MMWCTFGFEYVGKITSHGVLRSARANVIELHCCRALQIQVSVGADEKESMLLRARDADNSANEDAKLVQLQTS